MVHALQKEGDCHTNLNFSFLIIYILVPLYIRKFCDGHIILEFFLCVYVCVCVFKRNNENFSEKIWKYVLVEKLKTIKR